MSETTDGHPDCARFRFFRDRGFDPKCIIDAGASTGLWSDGMCRVFPEARFHLFEPAADIEEIYRDPIRESVSRHENFTLHKKALGAKSGSIQLYKGGGKDNPWGSTTLDMGDVANFEAVEEVPVVRLGDLIKSGEIPQPDLVKIDVQGSELEILKGVGKFIKDVDFLVLETWLCRGYGKATPLYYEIVNWLVDRHIHLVDLSEGWRDDTGYLVSQDMIFANAKHPAVARYCLK